MKKIFAYGFLLLVLGLFAAPNAMATPVVINFSAVWDGIDPNHLGRISAPNALDVQGLNIRITTMTVSGAGGADGTYAVSNGLLNFSTLGNTLNITGTANSVTGVLLNGGFTGWSWTTPTPVTGDFVATGLDSKNPALLLSLGINPSTQWAYFGFSITSLAWQPANSYEVLNVNIQNTAVPEPTTVLLLGMGLLGLAGAARRRQS